MTNTTIQRMSREEINALPLRTWDGPVQVIGSHDELTAALQHLTAERVLGFDTETRPAFQKGQSFPPALLQLATRHTVFIIQLGKIGLPQSLCAILADTTIIKTGVSLRYDIDELQKVAPFQENGFLDLGRKAKEIGLKNHGLRGLAAVVLGLRISKSSRTSNWARKDLTPAQIRYAATDAWVGREIYLRLCPKGQISPSE